jgi:hypothetical protein
MNNLLIECSLDVRDGGNGYAPFWNSTFSPQTA